jgi:LacI family transcriptional regulator
MVTLSDVATKAGVSVSAVSKVLSGAPGTRVSEETRERIHEAARDLGYRPNLLARGLKTARTQAVALVVPDVTNAIFAELMRGVEEEAHRHGYIVLLSHGEGAPDEEESIRALLGDGRIDGVLVQVGDRMRPQDLEVLAAGTLPVVFINSVHPGVPGSVTLDDATGMEIGTRHLIALGHTRIGFIGGHPSSFTSRGRERGFRDAMADAGIEVPTGFVTSLGYEPHAGARALAALDALDAPPTAVVVANLHAAHGALLEARRRGLRVPEDLSIVAMHDTWTADTAWPPLTTVRMPLHELGTTAMTALLARISAGAAADAVVGDPAPELVVRESTASPNPDR